MSGALLCLLAGMAAAAARVDAGQTTQAAGPAASQPAGGPQLAIAGFVPAAESDERDHWQATGLEELLSWRLRRCRGLVSVPVMRVHQARSELEIEDSAAESWERVCRLLGARSMLTGTTEGMPHALSLKLRLVPLVDGAAGGEATIGPAAFFEVLDEATRWVIDRFAITLEEPVAGHVFRRPSKSMSAVEYFAKAVVALREQKRRDAQYYVIEAVEYDVRLRPAQLLLAQLELRAGLETRPNAIRRLRTIGDLAKIIEDPADRIDAELGLALADQMVAASEAALTRLETALKLAERSGDLYGRIAAMNGMCDVLLGGPLDRSREESEEARQARLRRAAELQERVLRELDRMGDLVAAAPSANKLALIYEQLGETEKAGMMHRRTIELAQKTGARRSEATAWLFLGQWHRGRQQWREALEATMRCLELTKEASRAPIHIALAEIYELTTPPQQAAALDQYEQAHALLRSGTDLVSQLACLRQIATLRIALGRKEEARAALREAIDLAHALESPLEVTLQEMLKNLDQGKP